jgi:hypothetical protein
MNGSMALGELFVPARSLDYGIYQIKLTVAMNLSSQLSASAVTYVNIIPSPITVSLLQLGSSMVTHGQQQTLILDPGSYSIDPDSTPFNASVSVSVFNISRPLFPSARAGTTPISVASTVPRLS